MNCLDDERRIHDRLYHTDKMCNNSSIVIAAPGRGKDKDLMCWTTVYVLAATPNFIAARHSTAPPILCG